MKRENISKTFLMENKKTENDLTKKIIKSEEKNTNTIIEKKIGQQMHSQDILQSIIFNTAKECKEKTGRDMSYEEMRQMYG